ncbi:response regulator receiver domain [Dickeya chrysanthemi]|uniref:response regulator receiver domain n=1 Tax=Dickeya chrysanthemi TaxID=556 RepID=UPI000532DFFB|nr:response regulator receiver domain [Dickeya chrysanthemi]
MAEENTFKNLVHEAFIKPLRSVLIVDDQYPTWEEIFNSKITSEKKDTQIETRSTNKKWHNSATADEVMKLISKFRNQKPGFIIDIHDGVSANSTEKTEGSETPSQLADHLHQSDLLILDYNLEGAEAGTGGDIARKILSSVLDNQHFNLVVVHTSEDLNHVMYECLRALMKSCTSQFDEECNSQVDELDDLITEKESVGDFDRNLIEEKLDMASYIQIQHPEGGLQKALSEFMRGNGSYAGLTEWSNELGLEQSQKKWFFYWAIRTFEKKYLPDFTESPPKGLSWNISEACKWLRTSRGFVCFVRKGPENLLAELEHALVDWRPTPSRLLSAKYRDEISRIGAEVEDTSLRQRPAFAKFYETIRKPGKEDLPEAQIELLRDYKLKDHVSRQSEMLSFLVEENVAAFGKRIYAIDKATGFTFQSHYGVDLETDADNKTAISQYNRYVCCLPSREDITGDLVSEQLDSGHIFKLDDTWWVCATPACDLQPGQGTIAFKKGTDPSLRPFTAIRLHPVTKLSELTDRHINSGSYCYVEYDGKILGLGVKSPKEDTSNPAIQKVDWRAFVAQHGGIIKNGKLSLLELQLELDELNIKSEQREAEIVAKLRYEYALNYIQRVGASVSRIGLGYVAL